jgi:Flp pilus assembly protein TadB
MAQTNRRRRSKHRGTAAGTIQARGRTGRKPAGAEKPRGSQPGRGRRQSRFDQPPTWRSAFIRALLASGIFLAFVVVALHRPLPAALGLAAFTLLIYVPLGYYTDLFLYRRRQRKAAPAGRARARDREGR